MPRVFSWTLNVAYLVVLFIASPWVLWSAYRHGKYGAGIAAKLWGQVPLRGGDRPCVWLHAVSVGEVNLLATMLRELSSRRPDCEFVISTTTKTGYDLARKKYADYLVFYCPLDLSWATSRAMQRVRPDLLILAELELWPNLIAAAREHGAKVAIINGRLSDMSFRGYSRLLPVVARVLRKLDLIAAQDDVTAERFRRLGATSRVVRVTGSLKFDGAVIDRANPQTRKFRELAGFANDEVVFLAGSTQDPEEETALRVFRELTAEFPKLRMILVPRHPQRFDEVAELLESSGFAWARRSNLETTNDGQSRAILLVDTVGELGGWWGTAQVGFVGGSFGNRGGQNMLEPAAYGVATCFGPNTWNFRDIVGQLLSVEGAVVVRDERELELFLKRALTDPAWSRQIAVRGRQLVMDQQGATRRTVDLLLPLLHDNSQASQAA